MTVRQISVDDLATARDTGEITLIDVRDADEYAQAHIPDAMLIPLPELAGRLAEVRAEGTVHVVCQSGRRSTRGAEILLAAGIDAVSVDGGTQGWIASGRPTVTG